jgi:hypothetical protein
MQKKPSTSLMFLTCFLKLQIVDVFMTIKIRSAKQIIKNRLKPLLAAAQKKVKWLVDLLSS